ncbi:MAG TPA: TrbG/VirB9 family P-type conjugative transfer protein [Sphingomicrobium sp.]|nr:TrbG/VirB9 family P-type conjugative transfer protein [Sphingomicrobium sp.]
MRRSIPFAILLLVTAPASAQIMPHPGNGDPHLQVVDYSDGRVFLLRGVPGYQMMVELSPDEQIENVALGDSSAWSVAANKDGDRLFLKAREPGTVTNMTVVTSVRTYTFDLMAQNGPSADTPYTVQFRYPAPARMGRDPQFVDVGAISRRISHYRVSGDRALRPSAMTDDGEHTYISWPRGAAIPAIYTPDKSGNEILLNGMMGTDDVYVVDGVPQKLIFRIDRSVARADRMNPRKGR